MRNELAEIVKKCCRTGYFHAMNTCERAENICVFGLGRYFEDAFDQWNFKANLGVNILCDNNPEKWGKTVKGIPVISLDELYSLENLIVFPLVGDRAPIFKQMMERHIKCFHFEHYTFELMADTPRSPEWFERNRIMNVYDILADEQSKTVYAKALINRLDGFKYFYNDFSTGNEYFSDLFTFGSSEVFVDCGAYTGDTISMFADYMRGERGGIIYAFEVDSQNYIQLEKTAKSFIENGDFDAIYCHHAAVWSTPGELSFGREEHGKQHSVSVMKTGNAFLTQTVQAITIDDVTDSATFIKMDIEGSELNALRGAEKNIKKMRPKLAICIYHKLCDFWEIPMYLHEIMPEYRFYVRHHGGDSFGGTVLYACI